MRVHGKSKVRATMQFLVFVLLLIVKFLDEWVFRFLYSIISFCFSMISLSSWDNFLSRIQDIPPTAFQDLHSLEWIKLYNNLLTTLHYELMEPVLDSLQHIDIHSKCFWFITCIIDNKKINAKTIWIWKATMRNSTIAY